MAKCFFGFVRVLVCVLMFYAFANIVKDRGEIIVACVLLDLCSGIFEKLAFIVLKSCCLFWILWWKCKGAFWLNY
jgi:hypothetical protein